MDVFLEKMLRLSMNVMVTSMETMAKTMHEIQQNSEKSDESEDIYGNDVGQSSAFGNVSKLAIMPFFEMSKIPMNVFASVVETISQAKTEIQPPDAPDDEINTEPEEENYDAEVVPLSEEETTQETKAILTEEIEETSQKALWQIGRSGRTELQSRWTATFDYHVGTDIDEINNPTIPHLIAVKGGPKSKGATEKLNIHFSLDRDYQNGELAFIYDRWGAEKDLVFVDDELLTPIAGAGKGRFKHVALSLNNVSTGDHIITITTSGETEAGEHRIDYIKLVEIENPAEHG